MSWRCPFKLGLLILVFHYLTCVVNLGDSPTFVSRWRVLYTEWDWREWPWRGRRAGTRETRERWPLTTEVNRDSNSTNERGPSLVGFLGLSCRHKRFLVCLGCSSQPSTNIFSSPYTFSIPLSPPPSKLGWQPCWVTCLLVCVSGWDCPLPQTHRVDAHSAQVPF